MAALPCISFLAAREGLPFLPGVSHWQKEPEENARRNQSE